VRQGAGEYGFIANFVCQQQKAMFDCCPCRSLNQCKLADAVGIGCIVI
jgi:hypothetical protein